MDNSTTTWFCARTKPKHEHIAAANLDRHLGLEVFHPRLRLERATRRGLVRVVEPLFPCYIFIRGMSPDRADEVRHVTGISSLVRFGMNLATVPGQVIAELKACFENNQPVCVEDPLAAGTEVIVAEGVLRGASGVVVRVLPAKQRILILVTFLGRATMAEVDRNAVSVENLCLADLIPSLASPRPQSALASQVKSDRVGHVLAVA